MLYMQEHLKEYRRNPSGLPHLQTSSTQVSSFLCNDTYLQNVIASNVASYINTIIKED